MSQAGLPLRNNTSPPQTHLLRTTVQAPESEEKVVSHRLPNALGQLRFVRWHRVSMARVWVSLQLLQRGHGSGIRHFPYPKLNPKPAKPETVFRRSWPTLPGPSQLVWTSHGLRYPLFPAWIKPESSEDDVSQCKSLNLLQRCRHGP